MFFLKSSTQAIRPLIFSRLFLLKKPLSHFFLYNFSESQAKINLEPLVKMMDIIKIESSQEKLRKYLILCVSRNLETRELFTSLLMKIKETKNCEDFQDLASFWSSAFKTFKFFEKDQENMQLFKDIYKADIEFLISHSKEKFVGSSIALSLIKPASYLCEDREKLLVFASDYLLKNYKIFLFKELLYFMKDFSFLYQKGMFYEIYQYFPETPEMKKLSHKIFFVSDHQSPESLGFQKKNKEVEIDMKKIKAKAEIFNRSYFAVQKNLEFWKAFENNVILLGQKFNEKVFSDVVSTIKRNDLSPDFIPTLFPLIKRLYKQNMKVFSEETLKNVIHNLASINIFDLGLIEITKGWLIARMVRNAIDLTNVLQMFRTFTNKNNKNFQGMSPEDPFFEVLHEYLIKNLDKISGDQVVYFLNCYAFFNKKDLVLFEKLLNKLKNNNKLLVSDDDLGLLMRSLCIFELYDMEIWKLIEKRVFSKEIQTFLENPQKITPHNARISQIALGLLALSIEKPDFIEDKEKYKEIYEKFKKLYKKTNQHILIEKFNSLEMGTFSVYHILKALELNPIPEQIIEVFNVDLYIPVLNKEKLKEIEKLDLDKVIEKITDPDFLNESKKNLDFLKIKKTLDFSMKNDKNEEFSRDEEKNAAKNEEFVKKNDSLIIEIHGPDHYICNEQFLRGGTQLKERLLKKMGFRLMVIPYSECLEFQRKVSRRQIISELLAKLRTIVE